MTPAACYVCGAETEAQPAESGGFRVCCTGCIVFGPIAKDRWKAARAWNARVRRHRSPVEARKIAESIVSPPPVVEAVRRGRSAVGSVASALRMDPGDAAAEIAAAAADGYALNDRNGVLSIAPDLEGGAHLEPWEGGEPLTIGFITDTHAGHEGFASDALTDFCHWAVDQGAVAFCHSGDLVDGNYHHGQSFELKRRRAHNQTLDLLRALPDFGDVPYFLICGNHDESYFRATGMEVTELLTMQAEAAGRHDVIPLGTTTGRIQWGTGPDAIRVQLSHSRNKLEVGRLADENRPDIFAQGHYHDYTVKMVNGILYLHPGGFQRTSRFYRTLGKAPDVCGTVVTVTKYRGSVAFDHAVKTYRQQAPVWA